MSDLAKGLATLGLRHTAAQLDDVVALATKRRWSPTQLLEHLVETEQQEQTRRSLERRVLRSRLGRFTPMNGVRLGVAQADRSRHRRGGAAARLPRRRTQRRPRHAPGPRQTMIAQNIAPAAVLAGHHVLFKTAAEVLLDLGAQEFARNLAWRLKYYATRGLLMSGEIRVRPTTGGPPTCSSGSSRSSAGGTNAAVSCSRLTV
jgi:hypothetical protein